VLKLARHLVEMVQRGHRLYLHCWGGHGRTGTVVCIMLYLIYGLSAPDAMRRCQFVHDLRRIPIDVGSPQTAKQRAQVTRIISRLMSAKAAAAKDAAALHPRPKQPTKSDETLPAVSTDGGSARGQAASAATRGLRISGNAPARSSGGNTSRAGPPAAGRKVQAHQPSRLKFRRAKEEVQHESELGGLVAIGYAGQARQHLQPPPPQRQQQQQQQQQQQYRHDPMMNPHSAGQPAARAARRPTNSAPTRGRQAQNRRLVAQPADPVRSTAAR
jgi:hypothetical protein